jgi:hypothetical protein
MLYRILSTLSLVGLFLISCSEDEPTLKANPNFVYFLVGETNESNGDSYILPLLDPADIATARAIIADPTKSQIILAEITKDNSKNYYVNKDLVGNKRWSWHIAEFLGFTDFTIEIYDGWPTYVEENYNEWVRITKGENGNGRIGFWDYRIIREVAASELE